MVFFCSCRKGANRMVSYKAFFFLSIVINLYLFAILLPKPWNSPTLGKTSETNAVSVFSFSSSRNSDGNKEIGNSLPQLAEAHAMRESFLSHSSRNKNQESFGDTGLVVAIPDSTNAIGSQKIVTVEEGAGADRNNDALTGVEIVGTLTHDDPHAHASIQCNDFQPASFLGQRGSFWVLYNYVKASRQFACDESITYTTQADYTFLNNLVPLLERWQGPVSLALYSPGTDYNETLTRIRYLRDCSSPLVKEFVTFHLFFSNKHIPKNIMQTPVKMWEEFPTDCSAQPEFGEHILTFKRRKGLFYPVNVARNIAREMAQTHYVLASDIELYPNPNLIPNFMAMIQRNDIRLQRPNPKLFVLPIFEVERNVKALPYDKAELQTMLAQRVAIPFHSFICKKCHAIPNQRKWRKANVTQGLSIFYTGKRLWPYHAWEPIYIGTKLDPMYDERLSWEGRSDKMTQGYVLCTLDYDFHILDNAFLVHRPGIKRNVTLSSSNRTVTTQNILIKKYIRPELNLLYGTRRGCYL